MKLKMGFMQFTVALTIFSGAVFLNATSATGLPSSSPSIPLPDNTHLIDRDTSTGFEIYRTSRPYEVKNFKRLCSYGVRELMVLDGTGSVDQALAAKYCPGYKVAFNLTQSVSVPVTAEFLAKFDEWVVASRLAGTKIAFRCNCGCHRTGRLAAYYQMKYQGLSADQAIEQMYKYGKFMFLFPHLKDQVRALADYVAGKPCSQNRRYCVTTEPEAARLMREIAPDENEKL